MNSKFEDILNKFNSGGKMSDCNEELQKVVAEEVKKNLDEFDSYSKGLNFDTPYSEIKSILKPSGNTVLQDKIKEIYES